MTIGKWVIWEWIHPWIESATSKWAHEPLINGITYGMGNQCYLLWIRIIPWLNNGHRFDSFRSLLDVGWHHTYRHGMIPWLHPARCCCKLVYTTPLAVGPRRRDLWEKLAGRCSRGSKILPCPLGSRSVKCLSYLLSFLKSMPLTEFASETVYLQFCGSLPRN